MVERTIRLQAQEVSVEFARFDALTTRLAAPLSRRRGLVLLGVLGLTSVAHSEPVAGKKKPCPPCKKRKNGKCKGLQPDGTACPEGTCQGGQCVATPPPTCAQQCPESRIICVARAAGGAPLCANGGSGGDCVTNACTTDSDCIGTGRPYCITSYTQRFNGITTVPCEGRGVCATLT